MVKGYPAAEGEPLSDMGEGNADYAWHRFDPASYLKQNYAKMRAEDQQIIEIIRDFFLRELGSLFTRSGYRGIDVGTGANIYPALAMLPFCDEITLYEHSKSSLDWLGRQADANPPSWDHGWLEFWRVLCKDETYGRIGGDPRPVFNDRVEVREGSVFTLDPAGGRWDLGTMFFVAESITSRRPEFTTAVHRFLDVLQPGAPFAVAFMENSMGYTVAGERFPAVAVDRDDVVSCMEGRSCQLDVRRVESTGNPLRRGYSGMLVACGRVRGDSRF
jgi:hypothetical protein